MCMLRIYVGWGICTSHAPRVHAILCVQKRTMIHVVEVAIISMIVVYIGAVLPPSAMSGI